jgi:hypothetical protein
LDKNKSVAKIKDIRVNNTTNTSKKSLILGMGLASMGTPDLVGKSKNTLN